MMRGILVGAVTVVLGVVFVGWSGEDKKPQSTQTKPKDGGDKKVEKVTKTDAEWKKQLTDEQYEVTRKKGTERAFTGKYWNNHKDGTYKCICCGEPLFESDSKFDSGCGWPSFTKPIKDPSVSETEDRSHFMTRTEVTCTKCGAHLGHVFDDGPGPTKLRYCINSASLNFDEKQAGKKAEKTTAEQQPAKAPEKKPETKVEKPVEKPAAK